MNQATLFNVMTLIQRNERWASDNFEIKYLDTNLIIQTREGRAVQMVGLIIPDTEVFRRIA